MEFYGKRFFAYGSGVSGKAARRAIKRNGGKCKIYSDIDGVFIAPPERDYYRAVISPGIKPTHPVYSYCRARGIPTVGEAEVGLSLCTGRSVVGVTGTNGKTTVTRLIADMIGGTACGNIGYPISLAAIKSTGAIVCELSSFQLHGATIAPSVAVITNLSPDHADWHGETSDYYADKCNIASHMRGGYLVLGEDISVGALRTLSTEASLVRCRVGGATDGAYTLDGFFYYCGRKLCAVDELSLIGVHNIKNALCAIAAAKCVGASDEAIISALNSATLAPHRIKKVASGVCGKTWVDDSKGTNISATLAAIDAVEGSICLIVGGRGKGADFCELFDCLDKKVLSVVAMGEAAQSIRDAAAGRGRQVAVVSGLHSAVKVASELDGDTVLLSPACASFDEFSSYIERGKAFERAVSALAKKNKK